MTLLEPGGLPTRRDATNQHVGQHFAFPETQITVINRPILSPRRGVGHRHRTLGWDAVDATASCATGFAGRDQLRERSSGRVDERCRSVRQNRVDPMPQWSASSLRKANRPDRARTSQLSAGDGGEKSPILRGERDISRKAIAQGMSDVLRCPVCSCAHSLHNLAHETAGAARIRHSLLPPRRDNDRQNLGQTVPRERGCVSAV